MPRWHRHVVLVCMRLFLLSNPQFKVGVSMVWGGSGVVKGSDSMPIDTPPPYTPLKDNASCGPMTICHTGSSICTDVIKQTDVHSHWLYDRLTAVHQLRLISFVWNMLLNKHSSIKLWFSSAFKITVFKFGSLQVFQNKMCSPAGLTSNPKTVQQLIFFLCLFVLASH